MCHSYVSESLGKPFSAVLIIRNVLCGIVYGGVCGVQSPFSHLLVKYVLWYDLLNRAYCQMICS